MPPGLKSDQNNRWLKCIQDKKAAQLSQVYKFSLKGERTKVPPSPIKNLPTQGSSRTPQPALSQYGSVFTFRYVLFSLILSPFCWIKVVTWPCSCLNFKICSGLQIIFQWSIIWLNEVWNYFMGIRNNISINTYKCRWSLSNNPIALLFMLKFF